MKKYLKISILVLAIQISSCKKEESKVTNSALAGEWTITSFDDNGIDKTAQFAPYNFTFDNSGNLKVDGGGMMDMCKWTMQDSIYHFNMMGMHTAPLSELDDDWILMSSIDTVCSFMDDNPAKNCTFMLRRK